MGSWSKTTVVGLILQAPVFWDSHGYPSFLLLFSLSCSKFCVLFLPSQNIQPSYVLVKRFGGLCNPNFHCSTQFYANFSHTKKLVLWVCTFLDDEKSILEHSHPNKLQTLFLKFLSDSSKPSIMHEILPQKSTDLKMEVRESLTWRQKSIPVTPPSKLKICPHLIL